MNDRVRVYAWTMAELKQEAICTAFDQAFEAGYYNAVMKQTDRDYLEGNALSEIY
jgi:hypothetical protein